MKKSQIQVGGHYIARVSEKLVTVRVDAIREVDRILGCGSISQRVCSETHFDVTNLVTGRKLTFRSAQKFRGVAKPPTERPQTVNPPGRFGEEVDPLRPSVEQGEQEEEGEQGLGFTERLATGSAVTAEQSVQESCAVATKVDAPALCTAVSLAERLAAAKPPTTGLKPTEEQEAILSTATEIEAVKGSSRVLVVCAGAGAGKTSTLKMLELVLGGAGQYTAFNSSLVAESKAKFSKAGCNTTHSLAFRAVGSKYAHRLQSARIRSDQVAQMISLQPLTVTTGVKEDGTPAVKTLQAGFLAGQVATAIKRFCQSDAPAIVAEHFRYIDGIDVPEDGKRGYANNNLVRDYLLPYAQTAWADLSSEDGQLPFSHDVYVKVWQLGTGDSRPYIAADYILLDEFQDTAPVFLNVLQQQTHALLILVGDSNQRIYEWRGAVDASESFPDAPRRLLSQSFRFGQTIADVANSILRQLDQPTDLIMRGLESIPSRVAEVPNPHCVLCRTNAGAVGVLLNAVAEGKRPHLIGGGKDVVEFVRAARDLQAGKAVRHQELCCFSSWREVQEYAQSDEGEDLKLMVKIVDTFGVTAILSALETMPSEADADLVVSTAHKSKGREWPTVRLHDDFPPLSRLQDPDIRLLYVAATRAQEILDISRCPPFVQREDPKTGEPCPVIELRFTILMPSEEALSEYRRTRKEKKTEAQKPARINGTHQPIQLQCGQPGATGEFSWANLDGKWLIRGPDGSAGKRVTVTRKSGSKSQEGLGKIVKRIGEHCFYALQ